MDNYQIDSYSGAEIEALLGKIDDLGNASQSSAGLMSAADKTKLDGLDSGAQANVLEGVKIAGADLPITEKKVNIPADSFPTSGSNSLVRSGGVFNAIKDFITRSVNDLVNYYTKTEVNNIIGSLQQFHYEIYASTSAVTNPQSNVLYLIGPTGTGSDKYEEYVYSNGWVKIGDTTIDLSGYPTTEQMNAAINNALMDYATKEEVSQLGQEIADKIGVEELNNFRRYTQESGFFICDVNGNIVIQYNENGFDVAKVSQHTKDKIKEIVGDISGGRETNEEGLYFIDSDFNIVMQYTGDGFDVAKLSSEFINKLSLKPNDKFVYVAAHDSSSYDKKKADYVCTGEHDEIVINAAIASLTRGGTVQLLDGNYFIDGFNSEGNSAIYFGNTNYARVVNIKGTTENKSYNTRFGAVIHVTQAAIESMNNNDTYRVFYGTSAKPGGGGDFGTYTWMNNVNFENFYLMIYDASKKWIGIDGRHFGNMYIKQVGVYTEQYFNDRFLHIKPATPVVGSIGVYSVGGSNDEMARCGYDTLDVGGMYYGIVCEGVDHLIMKTCSAARCVVGYKFIGAMAKTLTMLNCCDEGNYRLPEFSSTGHLTCIDFNIERFNADDIPDDITENTEHQAIESNIGGWHGFISYTLQGSAYGISSLFKNGEGVNFKIINLNTPASSWFNN